ncbi:MAG TPA: hypothetical protein VGB04_14940 [Allosphingosinicella sp.]|jgi:hypothetical protein
MAKPALAIMAAALAAAPAPAAPPLSAEEALARQASSLRSGLGCDRGAGEIVVCARQGHDPNRLPLPVEPEPGARNAGEPPDPDDSLALSAQKCTTVGPNQQCSGGLPILGIAIWAVQTAVKAIKERE